MTVRLFVLVVSSADLFIDSLALLLVVRVALLLRHSLGKDSISFPESTERIKQLELN